ncbi:hypothetical protein MA16_Dca004883 [Dendrobium catenatum]|uniref:Uncharacterized protein n=1 Tax=Dendrobium catenatum TaxID=906689 RepID=A0A2I0WGC2_9ASPA|nr:hypothetical protein MA16_Dca004883 [Dendrobium catenatum]
MSNERCLIVGFDIGRPFNHSLFAPDLTPIYELCHSRKSKNRALILHKGGGRQARREGRGEGRISSSTTAGTSPDHRRSLAGPPPEPHLSTAGVSPHHHLKARRSGPMFY